jgi:phenylpyruvate tautomerase PptA (4-oxalocrotonate tautomerase family)
MPFVRISVPAGHPADYRLQVGACVHDAMVETINAPQDDRFQVITEHHPAGLIVDPSFLGIARSAAAIIVQITLRSGRTPDQKRALYRAIARNLHERVQLRPEDVTVCLIENEPIDWSFGNGVAQYQPD